jgi:hypothetical protein
MIKYKVTTFSNEITPVEVVRETENMVFLVRESHLPYKEWKVANCHIYFDTPEEAKAHLVNNLNRKIAALKRDLALAEKDLEKAKNL